MGNFMIGDVYPPTLGRVDKVFCGRIQVWPKVEDQTNVFWLQCTNIYERVSGETTTSKGGNMFIYADQETGASEYRCATWKKDGNVVTVESVTKNKSRPTYTTKWIFDHVELTDLSGKMGSAHIEGSSLVLTEEDVRIPYIDLRCNLVFYFREEAVIPHLRVNYWLDTGADYIRDNLLLSSTEDNLGPYTWAERTLAPPGNEDLGNYKCYTDGGSTSHLPDYWGHAHGEAHMTFNVTSWEYCFVEVMWCTDGDDGIYYVLRDEPNTHSTHFGCDEFWEYEDVEVNFLLRRRSSRTFIFNIYKQNADFSNTLIERYEHTIKSHWVEHEVHVIPSGDKEPGYWGSITIAVSAELTSTLYNGFENEHSKTLSFTPKGYYPDIILPIEYNPWRFTCDCRFFYDDICEFDIVLQDKTVVCDQNTISNIYLFDTRTQTYKLSASYEYRVDATKDKMLTFGTVEGGQVGLYAIAPNLNLYFSPSYSHVIDKFESAGTRPEVLTIAEDDYRHEVAAHMSYNDFSADPDDNVIFNNYVSYRDAIHIDENTKFDEVSFKVRDSSGATIADGPLDLNDIWDKYQAEGEVFDLIYNGSRGARVNIEEVNDYTFKAVVEEYDTSEDDRQFIGWFEFYHTFNPLIGRDDTYVLDHYSMLLWLSYWDTARTVSFSASLIDKTGTEVLSVDDTIKESFDDYVVYGDWDAAALAIEQDPTYIIFKSGFPDEYYFRDYTAELYSGSTLLQSLSGPACAWIYVDKSSFDWDEPLRLTVSAPTS